MSRWPVRVRALSLVVAVGLLPASRQPTFDRADFLAAMNRLHQFYMAPEGLQRPNGLSINGEPDFEGIAAWIFDIYLACRSAGRSTEASWSEVVASITQSEEWKAKHPGQPSQTPTGCRASVQLNRAEFLQAMQRLDAFYRATEGLQRPSGLSINAAPDFEGIAAWIFDVYLNRRLAGRPIDEAFRAVWHNIEASTEWHTKHPEAATPVRFAVIGDYGIAGSNELAVSTLVKSWNVEFIVTTGDNNYMNGTAFSIDSNIGQYYADFIFPYTGSFPSSATKNRFFPVLGNHDWETPGATPYLEYFALPGNERYYDLVRYPVHFFFVDSDPHEPDGITQGSTQGQWLQHRLGESFEAFRFVFMHHAPFSSSLNGSTIALQWPYRSWGASAVIAGHDHTYERIVRDELPYVVNGAAGYALYSFGSSVSGSLVRYNAEHGAMLVEADKNGAQLRFINRSGTQIDSFGIAPPP